MGADHTFDHPVPRMIDQTMAAQSECPRCSGFGDYEGDTCRVCGGTGTKPDPMADLRRQLNARTIRSQIGPDQ